MSENKYTVYFDTHSSRNGATDIMAKLFGKGDEREAALKAAKDLKRWKPEYTVWLCEEVEEDGP